MRIQGNITKVMALCGKFPVPTKIITEGKMLEQTYLGCDISLEMDKDVHNKINKFLHICGSINRILENKTTGETS